MNVLLFCVIFVGFSCFVLVFGNGEEELRFRKVVVFFDELVVDLFFFLNKLLVIWIFFLDSLVRIIMVILGSSSFIRLI